MSAVFCLASFLPFLLFFCSPLNLLSLLVDWWLDSGCHRHVIALHVNVSRCLCIFAVLGQGSVTCSRVQRKALKKQ